VYIYTIFPNGKRRNIRNNGKKPFPLSPFSLCVDTPPPTCVRGMVTILAGAPAQLVTTQPLSRAIKHGSMDVGRPRCTNN